MNTEQRLVSILILVLILAMRSSHAESEGWHIDGVPTPDTHWRGHDGHFLAMLLITDDAAALYEHWNNKPGAVPFPAKKSVTPGKTVEAVVIFARCQPDASGNCNVWGKVTVEESNGSKLIENAEIPLWVGRPPPPGNALGISEHGVGMEVLDATEKYHFHVVAEDRTANRRVTLTRDLAVNK